MTLRIGSWKANIDGVEAVLAIEEVENHGAVTGKLQGYNGIDTTITGIWDETSNRLTLLTGPMPQNASPNSREFFEGYLISTPPHPAPGQDIAWTLTGFVQSIGDESFGRHRTNARRSRYGWFAEISEVA